MISMKRYSVLLILLFVGTINISAQVQDRFKTKKQNDTEQNNEEEGSAEPSTDRKANSSQPKIKPNEDFWDKVVIGGNASLSFGSYTFIYLAPSVGYKFTDQLVAGPGFIYQYAKVSAYNYNGAKVAEYSSTVYGPKAFLTYIVNEQFYGGFQFEYLNHKTPYIVSPGVSELHYVWTPVLFLEAGFTSSIGGKGYAQIGLRYNVLHGPDSPYGSPLFPVIGIFF